MNWITFGVGVLSGLYGIYTIYMRFHSPDKFGKLEAMQQSYGQGVGTLIHIVSYTVMPLIFGALMIAAGLRGVSLLN